MPRPLRKRKFGGDFATKSTRKYQSHYRPSHVSVAAWKRGRGLRGETKSVDLIPNDYACTNVGTVTALNLVRTGSTFTNRIGRKIAMQSLYITGRFTPQDVTMASTASFVRVVVVYDSQTNGALPAWADVIKSYDQSTSSSSTVFDHFNLDNRDRFKVVIDERLAVPATSATGVGNNVPSPNACELKFHRYVSLKNLETQFKADSSPAVIGDISSGSLIMLTFSDGDPDTSWNLEAGIRLRFTDN